VRRINQPPVIPRRGATRAFERTDVVVEGRPPRDGVALSPRFQDRLSTAPHDDRIEAEFTASSDKATRAVASVKTTEYS
jgi:hypothetical protein